MNNIGYGQIIVNLESEARRWPCRVPKPTMVSTQSLSIDVIFCPKCNEIQYDFELDDFKRKYGGECGNCGAILKIQEKEND